MRVSRTNLGWVMFWENRALEGWMTVASWGHGAAEWAFSAAGPGAGARRRPGVDRWRHAFVRAKHFREAARRADCRALDMEWTQGESGYESPAFLHERAHVWHEAAERASWGCR